MNNPRFTPRDITFFLNPPTPSAFPFVIMLIDEEGYSIPHYFNEFIEAKQFSLQSGCRLIEGVNTGNIYNCHGVRVA